METPLYVIEALADVQQSGRINMLDRQGVTALVGSSKAIEWLERASDSQYMTALNDMGQLLYGEQADTQDTDQSEWDDDYDAHFGDRFA